MPGPTEVYVAARRALLDALTALEDQLDALVLVGAQAIYLHTGEIDDAIATETSDGDVVVDPGRIGDDPLLEEALGAAGFVPDVVNRNPGAWLSPGGIEVDLMVPASVARGSGSRSVELPPHSSRATRRVAGLEGALVDNARRRIGSLESADTRGFEVAVAGPAALLVSKAHKVHERQPAPPRRRKPKDSHDVYRLLRDVQPEELAAGFTRLRESPISREPTEVAIGYLRELFSTPESPGSRMAGDAVAEVGDEQAVRDGVAVLTRELLEAVGGQP